MKPTFNTAIHECGHAVAACIFGIPLQHVTVIPNVWRERDDYGLIVTGETTGHVQPFRCFYINALNSNFYKQSSDYSDIIHSIVMTNCAGNVAELLEFGYAPSFIHTPDYRSSDRLLRIKLNDIDPEYRISSLFERTKQIMRDYKKVVKTMARYLELKKDISGNDFLRYSMGQMNIKIEDIQQSQRLRIHEWPKK